MDGSIARTDGRQDKTNQVEVVENVKARITNQVVKNVIIVSLIIIKVNLILLL